MAKPLAIADKFLPSGLSGFVPGMLTIKKKEYFKRLLSQKLNDLLTGANTTASGMTDYRDLSPDPLDRASMESDTSFGFRIKGRESILIRKIKDALTRLEDDTFGICDECGEEIPEARLQARLVATLCINCKEQQENQEENRGL
jgi:DnaK suppressor protein